MSKAKKSIDVEKLVTWALLDQGLGWAIHGQGSSGTGFAELGTRIDTGGIGVPTPARLSDNDALVVRDVILTLEDDAAEIVIRHGRIGDRPDWCEEGVGEWRQKRGKNGHPAWHYERPGDRRSPKTAVMEFVGWRKEEVDYWRTTYRLWWHSLDAMVGPLNERLERHEALRPGAPLEPWVKPMPVIHTPDGPLQRHSRAGGRVSAEYVEIGSKRIKRSRLSNEA
ncbi:hypothetical protein [Pelagibacterium lentulum]|uniref:Uncharacterized protein n=1 Tax=Pelagibacterium lentulum TaxID=2029865 RepID=A0A916RPF0_9HYPH|nr:hypothetical protein [Pelagibacterium lentulum]GGA63797.1 hypothetical protein GCM10011499_37720 [Pelagibacterium lentulum]